MSLSLPELFLPHDVQSTWGFILVLRVRVQQFRQHMQRGCDMKIKFSPGVAVVSLALSGCVVAPAPMHRPYYAEPVLIAPPPPRTEYFGTPPVAGHVWIGGFWNWAGNRHEWVPGHWDAPRPGYNWAPHHWEREGDRWRLQGGRWEESRERHDRHEHEYRERREWR